MKMSNVETFLKEMDGCDAEYQFDVETGWTHENVCEDSYTDGRLNWVFGHVKTSVYGDGSTVSEKYVVH